MLEPAQLDILQIKEVGSIDVIFVSTSPGVATETALGDGFVYVDWGLSHGLEHRRAFPDAPEALTRVSRANIALELLLALGGAAYLPYTMVAEHLQTSRLYRVEDAPSFERTAYAAYLVRSARSELIESCIDFIVPPTELP
jgi:DNA-binding transcriptional LysR family regulator